MHQAQVTQGPLRGVPLRMVQACQGLRGRRLPFVAVAFGTGVGLYFALPVEPLAWQAAGLAICAMTLFAVAYACRDGAGVIALLMAALVCGLLSGIARTAVVAGPVLEFRYYGSVEGRVVHIDRSSSGAVRLTLDQVRLDGIAPDATPRRARVSLHGPDPETVAPGDQVMTTAHLSGPNGPTEPGGFDFQRHAWFLKLGAIGYSRVDLLRTAPPDRGLSVAIARLRTLVSDGMRARLPGVQGEVAAAITTGDRSGLPDDVVDALRASNLAHLLAISGLHMGLLVGFVFWAVRGGLALWPAVALRHPTRAWAAACALPFAIFYLFLSGGSVATQRAFVMAAVMLIAILVGRRALSLRSVALAAILVLVWRPESLTGPGFQMSFAATGALVVAFRGLAPLRHHHRWGAWFTGWRGGILSLLISSIVAGAATAPFAALHFNRVGQFGVLANLLAVPAMGMLVMPLLLLGLLLWPLGLGLEVAPFWLAGQGIAWIIGVAEFVAGLPGSVGHVKAPGPVVLPLLGLGMAVLGCTVGRGRWLALSLVVVAAMLWLRSPRPDVLIASDGRVVGIMTAEGRQLSRDEGAAFAAMNWLENDGDGASQWQAASRRGVPPDLPEIVALRGKTGLDAALNRCATEALWIVTPVRVEAPSGQCRIFDERSLRETGALAITKADPDGTITIRTSAEGQGRRPWTRAGRESVE
ncbi:ComEC/Rec2 family competence protein [Jannaschia sp. 2305UL9-9]|uniref:ComEC/Rec2 family competence protein n=1 Tax=Jannaschia sp. 2305UL9-9 TaxID=3121638 RepID=UPI003528E30F